MKKKVLKFGAALAVAAGMFCSLPAQTLTLDLPSYPKTVNSDGHWTGTLNDDSTAIQFGEFVFTHSSQWGGSYWEGSTYADNGDNTNYGYNSSDSLHSGSADWINHQWGVMAGGGIQTISGNTATAQQGNPYLVSYWGYYNNETYSFDFNNQSVKVNLADGSLFSPQEIWICNHPWPYYGNLYGDGFARPLNQPGDLFLLKITALNAAGGIVGTVKDTLAVYDPSKPNGVYQKNYWHKISFPTRWTNVKTLYFTMESTDADPLYGPNTAVYFCMDKLKVNKTGRATSTQNVLQKAQKSARVVSQAVEVTNYFPKTSYTGGKVIVYNAGGKEVLNMTVEAGEKINLSMLPAGEYRLLHGHLMIPISKK